MWSSISGGRLGFDIVVLVKGRLLPHALSTSDTALTIATCDLQE